MEPSWKREVGGREPLPLPARVGGRLSSVGAIGAGCDTTECGEIKVELVSLTLVA